MSLTKMFEQQELARLAFDYIIQKGEIENFTAYVLSRVADNIKAKVADYAADKSTEQSNG